MNILKTNVYLRWVNCIIHELKFNKAVLKVKKIHWKNNNVEIRVLIVHIVLPPGHTVLSALLKLAQHYSRRRGRKVQDMTGQLSCTLQEICVVIVPPLCRRANRLYELSCPRSRKGSHECWGLNPGCQAPRAEFIISTGHCLKMWQLSRVTRQEFERATEEGARKL